MYVDVIKDVMAYYRSSYDKLTLDRFRIRDIIFIDFQQNQLIEQLLANSTEYCSLCSLPQYE